MCALNSYHLKPEYLCRRTAPTTQLGLFSSTALLSRESVSRVSPILDSFLNYYVKKYFDPCCIFIFTCSSTPPPVWHNRTPNSLNSPYPPQSTPPLLLSSPNAHSSPRGAQRGRGGSSGDRSGTNSTDLSSLLLLGNGGLEHSLLEAVEGLGNLNLGGDAGIAPLLPEKRRTGEVGELGSRSPSLSGFSSPRSGSSLSIPLSSSLTSDPFRGLSGASSPGAGTIKSYLVSIRHHI